MEEDFDEKLAHYIEIGAIEVAGLDENGEFIFAINEKSKEVAPELWESHVNYVDETLVELYEAGYVKVDYDENLEATISLSPEGLKIAKEMGILPIDMPEIPDN